jgi:hypothetical protein
MGRKRTMTARNSLEAFDSTPNINIANFVTEKVLFSFAGEKRGRERMVGPQADENAR